MAGAGECAALTGHTVWTQMARLLVWLQDGRSLAAEKRWFEQGFRTARPGAPAGGVIELRPGERVWLTVDFVPGRYALLCAVSTGPGHTHLEQNEAVEFTVR